MTVMKSCSEMEPKSKAMQENLFMKYVTRFCKYIYKQLVIISKLPRVFLFF